jgi:hypothetical protein
VLSAAGTAAIINLQPCDPDAVTIPSTKDLEHKRDSIKTDVRDPDSIRISHFILPFLNVSYITENQWAADTLLKILRCLSCAVFVTSLTAKLVSHSPSNCQAALYVGECCFVRNGCERLMT